MTRALVLGGGPAGLYAALGLARRGVPVTLVERERWPGGLAAGFEVAGQPVDHGSHRLHPSIDPGILADLRALLGDELQLRRRNGRIRLGGRWLHFPLAPADLATNLPPGLTLRLALGAAAAALRPRRSSSFAEVVATGLGRPMGESFYFPYARKIWGVEPESLSGEQARRRIAADSPTKLLRKALSRGEGAGRSFYYPAGGFGRIPEVLAEAAAAAGADLRLGAEVRSLRREGSGWVVETSEGTHEAPLVLSTLPVALLARLIGPPPDIAPALDRLASRSMVLVYPVVPVDHWTPFDAHYFPGPEVAFTRVSEPKNYRDSSRDPAGRTVLCAELPCDAGDEVWEAPDSELLARVRRGLVAEGLPDPGEEGVVRRIRFAYPIYRVGVEAAFDRVDAWLGGLEGLVTFGRQGLFAHDNTHHALAMAAAAVDAVTEDLTIDPARWARAREAFTAHVVED